MNTFSSVELTTDEAWLLIAVACDRAQPFSSVCYATTSAACLIYPQIVSDIFYFGLCGQLTSLHTFRLINESQYYYMDECIKQYGPPEQFDAYRWGTQPDDFKRRAAFCRLMASNIWGVE